VLVILPKQICLSKTGQLILPKQNGILKALIIKQVKILLRQNMFCLGKNISQSFCLSKLQKYSDNQCVSDFA
jgi:hypothetical protein